MVSVRGRSEVKRFIAQLPEEIEKKVLRGAARAGGKVIADEAKLRAPSDEVREDIVIRTSGAETGRVVVKITVKPGWGRSVGIWAEYGTDPHFITVDDSQRAGQGIRRINQQVREAKGDGSLVIGGKFVGATVFHPGARAIPFLRPSLDTRKGDAITAAQGFINARISRRGIVEGNDAGSDE